MNQDYTSFQSAKSKIEYFASDKTRYPFWIIMGTLRPHGLDAMESAGYLLDSEDDDEVILALQILDNFGVLKYKFLPSLEACLCHENLIVRLAAVDTILKNDEVPESTLVILESWINDDESIVNVVGAYAIATIDPKQTQKMCRLLAVMLADRSVAVDALERLLQLDFQDKSILDDIEAYLADSENLGAVFCNARIVDLLGDGELIGKVARSFIAKDDSWYKIHGCKLLARLATYSDDATVAEVRAQLDDFDPFVVRAAEEALRRIEIPF